MIVFEWLKNWFDANEQLFKQKEVNFSELLRQESDKPSQFVDVFAETRCARVSLWKTEECDFEVINNESGKYVFWENRSVKSFEDLSEFLTCGFSKL